MVNKYFEGNVPNYNGKINETDEDLEKTVSTKIKEYEDNMENLHFSNAIEAIWAIIARTNKYVDETTPWSLAKDEAKADRLKTVIYNLLESLRISAVLLAPVMPETCEKILHAVNAENTGIDCAATFGMLEAGKEVNDVGVLFARIDEAKMLERIAADNEARKAAK